MKETRKIQVIHLLEYLNGMSCGDLGQDFVSFELNDDCLLVSAPTRSIRVELESLLSRFMHMCVYVLSNTDLKILFYD